MKLFTLCAGALTALWAALASAQDLLWSTTIGGPGFDGAFAAVEAHGGGYVVGGFTSAVAYGSTDLRILKTDPVGNVLWSVTRGGPWDDTVREVQRTSDGGYVAAGWWMPSSTAHDVYLVRLDGGGNLLWERTYDFGPDDRGHGVCQTADGGFVVAGQRWFGNVTFGSYDVLLMKTDASGVLQWFRTFAHEDYGADVALDVQETSDGGLVVGGFTQSSVWDAYVIRTDAAGNPLWQRTYPGTWECTSIQETSDGGFAMTGSADQPNGASDVLLLRTDSAGNTLWQRQFGGSGDDCGQSVREMPCGGFAIIGQNSLASSWSVYVIRTDENGAEAWSRTLGGQSDDRGFAVVPTSHGTLFVAGWTWSYGQGLGDTYLLELDDSCADFLTYCFGDGTGAPCPCGNAGASGRGCANGTEASGAELSGDGTPSVGAGNLTLSGSGLVPGQPGLYFQGENAVNGGSGTPFGDGLRCAGGNVRRLEVANADAGGRSSTSVNVGVSGGVAPGDVRRYQLWYRDPTGSPCGFGFNLTNGLEITWTP